MEKLKNSVWLIGVGIVIGVILTIILIKIFGARLSEVNIGIAKFEIPTPTSTVTSTGTATPTYTITPPQTLTPTIEVVKTVLFEDDFIDNKNGWQSQNDEVARSTIIGGKYVHEINCPDWNENYYCGLYILVPRFTSRDFQLEFDETIEELYPDTEVMTSIKVRNIVDGTFYIVNFRNLGTFSMNYYYQGNRNVLLEENPILNYSRNESTTFGVYANGPDFKVLVNGEPIAQAEDGHLYQEGSVYIVLSVLRGGSAKITLDNIRITEP